MSVGLLGKHPLPLAETSCLGLGAAPRLGEIPVGSCGEPGCGHAVGEVYLHSHESRVTAVVAPVCLGSRREPVPHQL